MSFLFASSHLTEVKRPEDEEEEEDVQPMQRSGMVRAFSHLPQQVQGQPAAPRPFAPVHLPSWATEPEPGSEHEPDAETDTDRHEPEDTSPWYNPGTKLEDHFPEGRSNHNTDPGIAVPMRDLRDADPATFGKEAAPRGATQPRGRWFEKRPTPGFAPPIGKPEFSDLVDRTQGPPPAKPEFNDLVYRGQPSAFRDPAAGGAGDHADNPGIAPYLLAAKAGAKPQSSPSSQAGPPPRTTPSSPQPIAQNSKPGAQAPASKPKPVQGAAPQKPAATGQPPQRQLTTEERDELFTKEGKPRKPIGQLGIRGGKGLGIDGKPSTVCLYDGGETRKKCGGNSCVADAYALQQAAGTYASDGTWMINIANPDWREQLASIKKAEESNGRYIDRIMIFDHGNTAKQEFSARSKDGKTTGKDLAPGSPDWQLITSSVRPRGDVVLAGCSVADQDWNDWNPVLNQKGRYLATDGEEYLNELYRSASAERAPTIHAYDKNVRHRTYKGQHSVTVGRQHSVTNGVYKITE